LELEKRAVLGLHMGHPALADGARPISPNFHYVGMMSCREAKPLQGELSKLVNEATNGIILVAFGTAIRASQMDDAKRRIFTNAFSQLNQTVIWKWESGQMDAKPANVHLSKWLPQQDLLGHPNVKLFIGHGGQSSFQETLCHKKPTLIIPVAGDQLGNGADAKRLGFGDAIPFHQLSEESLLESIQRLMNDKAYSKRATELGDLVLDQETKPLDRAIWWMEYLLRHPQPNHLKSPAADLTFMQYFLLDVFVMILLVIITFIVITFKLGKWTVEKLMKSSKTSKKQKKS